MKKLALTMLLCTLAASSFATKGKILCLYGSSDSIENEKDSKLYKEGKIIDVGGNKMFSTLLTSSDMKTLFTQCSTMQKKNTHGQVMTQRVRGYDVSVTDSKKNNTYYHLYIENSLNELIKLNPTWAGTTKGSATELLFKQMIVDPIDELKKFLSEEGGYVNIKIGDMNINLLEVIDTASSLNIASQNLSAKIVANLPPGRPKPPENEIKATADFILKYSAPDGLFSNIQLPLQDTLKLMYLRPSTKGSSKNFTNLLQFTLLPTSKLLQINAKITQNFTAIDWVSGAKFNQRIHDERNFNMVFSHSFIVDGSKYKVNQPLSIKVSDHGFDNVEVIGLNDLPGVVQAIKMGLIAPNFCNLQPYSTKNNNRDKWSFTIKNSLKSNTPGSNIGFW